MLIYFCKEMGFSSVVLVGHDDGGLLALKAAQRVQSSTNPVDVKVKGVVLLTVCLSREVVPGLAKILMRTTFGKKNLVHSLLRTEIGQVVNRRAWYDATKLTTDVLSLYKVNAHTYGCCTFKHVIHLLMNDVMTTAVLNITK
ncbi:putative alpha/Beta hydrolase [Helianthus annuus]|nr:putative alpha/Beta hydrolase [Helianthus annuus]